MTDNNQMPEAVSDALKSLRAVATLSEHQGILYRRADALESFWRIRAVQPAKVRTSPALEKVLESAELSGKHYDDWSLLSAVVAVRQEVAQAAEAGKVRMPKVREFLSATSGSSWDSGIGGRHAAALAELDAAEGRKP